MSGFKIEKNVPMPVTSGRGPTVDYPFLEMEVGDSIFVPGIDAKKASGQIGFWKKNHGMNFAIRAMQGEVVNEDGEVETVDGVRIWVRDPSEKSNRGRKPANAATTEPAGEAPEAEAPDAEGETTAPSPKPTKGSMKKIEESEY